MRSLKIFIIHILSYLVHTLQFIPLHVVKLWILLFTLFYIIKMRFSYEQLHTIEKYFLISFTGFKGSVWFFILAQRLKTWEFRFNYVTKYYYFWTTQFNNRHTKKMLRVLIIFEWRCEFFSSIHLTSSSLRNVLLWNESIVKNMSVAKLDKLSHA